MEVTRTGFLNASTRVVIFPEFPRGATKIIVTIVDCRNEGNVIRHEIEAFEPAEDGHITERLLIAPDGTLADVSQGFEEFLSD